MIVYSSTKADFCQDVLTNQIEDKIYSVFKQTLGHKTTLSEIRSWKNSMFYMNNICSHSDIPDDTGVAIEYRIPQTSKRVDFILTGKSAENKNIAVLVELKQWESAELTEKDGIVSTYVGRGHNEVSHPSYQAWTYAALIEDFNEAVETNDITLKPCAYLHNYICDDVITNSFYEEHLLKAPVFLKEDALKLQNFIKQFVKHGDKDDILYLIENGRIRPSKNLADKLVSLLQGKREFVLIDDQKLVFETAIHLSSRSAKDMKNVLIVEGGPGTGKSVVAINLLVKFIENGLNARYVTKNAAPRTVYESKLTGSFRKSHISNLFTGSGAFTETAENSFDVLIVDEAHRLNEKSGMFQNKGENQIKEIISSSALSVFFIDEDQRVTLKDIGDVAEIERWAKLAGAGVQKLSLESQFRCNGADGYLAWLDNVLQIKETANETLEGINYDFRLFDDPHELRKAIEQKNRQSNKARLVAGYCWDWVSQKDANAYDIEIPEHSFKARWNLKSDGSLWILKPESVREIGCIHTCQGLEVDYVGVIIGDDLVVRDETVVTDAANRSRMDSSVKGYKRRLKEDPDKAKAEMAGIIKNTYRTLMTRGAKGCYVYCTDSETAAFFKKAVGALREEKELVEDEIKILSDTDVTEEQKFTETLPVYSLEAAAGGFSDEQMIENLGWFPAQGLSNLSKDMFVAKVKGKSMEPIIADGSWCIFRFHKGGSRNGQIVLVASDLVADSEQDGCFTVKRYSSEKDFFDDGTWLHKKIVLAPENRDFDNIVLENIEPGAFRVVAEFVRML